MQGTRTVTPEAAQVFRCSIAFVRMKTIFRKSLMRFDHQAITRDLCENGGGGNGHAQPVALNHHPLLDHDRREPDGIEDEEIRGRRKLMQGLFHRTSSGLPYIHRINDRGIYDSHAKAKRHAPN
jgi:hypothetical protein